MDTANKSLYEIAGDELYHQPVQINKEPANDNRLVLFVSLDICNSTELKYEKPEWYQIVQILYDTRLAGENAWKFNGDEVLFKFNVKSLLYIADLIKEVHKQTLRLGKDFTNILKTEIQLKATVWIADVKSGDKHTAGADGVTFRNPFHDQEDHVGKAVDEGFRLTKNTAWSKVAVDPKIVYALLISKNLYGKNAAKKRKYATSYKIPDVFINAINESSPSQEKIATFNEFVDDIIFSGYQTLKGVWKNLPYPVFWYYSTEDSASKKIKCFEYELPNGKRSFDEVEIGSLHSIFETAKIDESVVKILERLTFDFSPTTNAPVYRAHLYYMVACVSPFSDKVLIVKRSEAKRHLNHVWDFGNVKHKNTKRMIEAIQEAYKKTGLDIKVVTDPNRGDNVKPIGFCAVYRNEMIHNGLMCCARIIPPAGVTTDEGLLEIVKNYPGAEKEYSDARFIDANEADSYISLPFDTLECPAEPAGQDFAIAWFKNSIQRASAEVGERWSKIGN
ncbi:MAG: hypothetical protein FWC82_03180 [Firmicutes bacterium]|nr:hypothetical protein [Bacillota bacterium]